MLVFDEKMQEKFKDSCKKVYAKGMPDAEENHLYAMRIANTYQVQVDKSIGVIETTNKSVEDHGKGDVIMCYGNEGFINVANPWIVNGRVFTDSYIPSKDQTKYTPLEASNKLGQNHIDKENKAHDKSIEQARNADLSIAPEISKEVFSQLLVQNGNDSLSKLNGHYLSGRLKIYFQAEAFEDGSTSNMEFSRRVSRNGTAVAYCLENKPIIIKNIEEDYKTLRGVINAMFSATRGTLKIPYTQLPAMLSEVQIMVDNNCIYMANLGDKS